ncbi:4Fe-4S dicluster domain-containing protein [Desulfonatronum thiosulfatophilum]|uniref:4Fe-4S dicluster domain-containing protein n=1 Tax=Desulfonatronum thiosulfatophilum TaxID=617002 RepID=A0A1G6B0J5_9BACT|nr:4Fe-4S dicluster domain-containing protein [Desulfonatronum thiosulfatophilum]SDB14065.1 4Fe-4S dicluster domain-containing protein [Desulfonatronum thiosulfatophilum]
MAEAKFIANDKLTAWLDELSGRMRVLAPTRQGDAVVFAPYAPGQQVELDAEATAPPKSAVFPASEELLRYDYRKDPENLGQVEVELLPTISPEPTLVFGSRPCGARGFLIFDRVYDGAKYKDPYYLARREATIFATIACRQAENSCFCHSVGSAPGDATGSDLLLTPVEGGYVVEGVSDKAAPLLESSLLEAAGDKVDQAKSLREKALQEMGDPQDFGPASKKLLALFDNLGFWEEMSAKCISCGACTYLCPTCYCFNITDENAGLTGRRVRSWDNCMSFQFTMEASGHNPRPTKAHRLRNRVGHKFSYYPDLHEKIIACCGCGRCIKSCPVSVDIREIVTRAMDYQPKAVEEAAK